MPEDSAEKTVLILSDENKSADQAVEEVTGENLLSPIKTECSTPSEESANECEDISSAEEDAIRLPEEIETEKEKEDRSENEQCVKESKNESGFLSFLFELAETVSVSIAIVMVLLTLCVRHSPVNGSSMYPTILGRNTGISASEMVGEDILLISDLLYTPKSGDIVVIQTPTLYSSAESSMNHPIVKRVIAVGGDTMTIDFENWYIEINGEVFENGRNSADYVNYSPSPMTSGAVSANPAIFTRISGCTVTKEKEMVYTITIPEGYLFVMGDNRNNSSDSRAIGLIDERWVIGRSIIRIYPFDRIGVVE